MADIIVAMPAALLITNVIYLGILIVEMRMDHDRKP